MITLCRPNTNLGNEEAVLKAVDAGAGENEGPGAPEKYVITTFSFPEKSVLSEKNYIWQKKYLVHLVI